VRDYGLLYEKVLRNEDINTKVDVYLGLPHGFWAMAPAGRIHESLERGQEEGLGLVIESIRAGVAYELSSQSSSINALLYLLLPSPIEHRSCLVGLLRREYLTLRVDPVKPLRPLLKIHEISE
jgi:hypothetical protein